MGRFERLERMAGSGGSSDGKRHVRVLVVSKNRSLRDGLLKALDGEGCEVIAVDDREDFQAVIGTQSFDLVVAGSDMGDTRDLEARTRVENPAAEFRRLLPLSKELIRNVIPYEDMLGFSKRVIQVVVNILEAGTGKTVTDELNLAVKLASSMCDKLGTAKIERDTVVVACHVRALDAALRGGAGEEDDRETHGRGSVKVLLDRLEPPLPVFRALVFSRDQGDAKPIPYQVVSASFLLADAAISEKDPLEVAEELRHGMNQELDALVAEAALAAYLELRGKEEDRQRKRLMLADSDDAHSSLVELRLANEGFEVFKVKDGARALSEVSQEQPDLVIAAINLPGLDGLTLLDRLKSIPGTSGIPVLLTTPKPDAVTVNRALMLGAEDVLKKPLDLDTLTAKIHRVLGIKKSAPDRISSRASDLESLEGGGSEKKNPASLAPGSKIGDRFLLLDLLGRGGMGWVYKARDLALDEVVALKILKERGFEDQEVSLMRFKQEIKLARKITHPHVVRIFDFMEIEGIRLISMEYVQGRTLKQIVKEEGPMDLARGLKVVLEVCAALARAHSMGIVHRDVKPQNVLIDSRGIAKVLDFGIARMQNAEGLTRDGRSFGTPEYMSPEQIMGRPQDSRSDIYSLGCLMYELFTGRTVFPSDSAMSIAMKQVKEMPVPPSEVNPAVPGPLERIILKSLQKDPRERYGSVLEIDSAVRQAFGRKDSA